MTRHDREVREFEVALDDVEVGAAAGARGNAYAHFTHAGSRNLALDELEWT
jgi:hypothetical protein